MREPNPTTADERAEHALDDLMRATDAFVLSWRAALHRLAAEPPALTRFRQIQSLGLAVLDDDTQRPAPLIARPWSHPHPLWDRDLDG